MELKPVKNYRHLFNRHTCSQCRYWNVTYYEAEGWDATTRKASGFACDRKGGPEGDWNAIEPEFHVCDRFNWRDPIGIPQDERS